MASSKKQIPLRISGQLYEQLAIWSESEFRSVNGQIEYLLTECVREWKKTGRWVPQEALQAPAQAQEGDQDKSPEESSKTEV